MPVGADCRWLIAACAHAQGDLACALDAQGELRLLVHWTHGACRLRLLVH